MTPNIQHVYPTNDTIEHLLETEVAENDYIFNGHEGFFHGVICKCPCNPTIKYPASGGIVVVHDAMDGRLGVEWANEILGNE